MNARTPSDGRPLVSVVVATRNRADLLRECLHAISRQTYSAIEVIVADDGSGDATRTRYASLCPALGERIKWLLPTHADAPGTGPAASRNRGLRAAAGTFVAFCDDDDRWIRDDHIATGVHALEASGADFYFTDILATREGEPSDHMWFPGQSVLRTGVAVMRGPDVFSMDLRTVLRGISGRVIHPDAWVVRKSVVDTVGGFWERLWFPEDYNLMMRLLDRANGILFRPDACVDYRLPVADSHSLRSSEIESLLQELMAAQHARVACKTSEAQRYARAGEAWALRRIGRLLRKAGRHRDARQFLWQGFCTYPGAGAALELFRAKA